MQILLFNFSRLGYLAQIPANNAGHMVWQINDSGNFVYISFITFLYVKGSWALFVRIVCPVLWTQYLKNVSTDFDKIFVQRYIVPYVTWASDTDTGW